MPKFSKKQLSKKQRRKKQNATRKLKGGRGPLKESDLIKMDIKQLFKILAEKQNKQMRHSAWSNRPANINLLVEKINLKSSSPPAKLTKEAQVAAGPTRDPDLNRAALTEIRKFVGGAGGVDDEFIDNTFGYLILTDDDGGIEGGGSGGGGGGGGDGGDASGDSKSDGGGGGGDGDDDIVTCDAIKLGPEGKANVTYNITKKVITYIQPDVGKSVQGPEKVNVLLCGVEGENLKVVFGEKGANTDMTIELNDIINNETKKVFTVNENKKEFINALLERQTEIADESKLKISNVMNGILNANMEAKMTPDAIQVDAVLAEGGG